MTLSKAFTTGPLSASVDSGGGVVGSVTSIVVALRVSSGALCARGDVRGVAWDKGDGRLTANALLGSNGVCEIDIYGAAEKVCDKGAVGLSSPGICSGWYPSKVLIKKP